MNDLINKTKTFLNLSDLQLPYLKYEAQIHKIYCEISKNIFLTFPP